jgi:formate hydrogenlyase transcriptional activator
VSRLILDGTPLPEVLAVVAQVAEASRAGAQCSIWLVERDGKHIYCAAAPSCAGFREHLVRFSISREGGPLAAAVDQQTPIYVADTRSVPEWQEHLKSMAPLETRALWAVPFIARTGQCRGVIAIHHREPRSLGVPDLELIKNLSSIAFIAIEHHLSVGRDVIHGSSQSDALRFLRPSATQPGANCFSPDNSVQPGTPRHSLRRNDDPKLRFDMW